MNNKPNYSQFSYKKHSILTTCFVVFIQKTYQKLITKEYVTWKKSHVQWLNHKIIHFQTNWFSHVYIQLFTAHHMVWIVQGSQSLNTVAQTIQSGRIKKDTHTPVYLILEATANYKL